MRTGTTRATKTAWTQKNARQYELHQSTDRAARKGSVGAMNINDLTISNKVAAEVRLVRLTCMF